MNTDRSGGGSFSVHCLKHLFPGVVAGPRDRVTVRCADSRWFRLPGVGRNGDGTTQAPAGQSGTGG
jgi:hypothetical protein